MGPAYNGAFVDVGPSGLVQYVDSSIFGTGQSGLTVSYSLATNWQVALQTKCRMGEREEKKKKKKPNACSRQLVFLPLVGFPDHLIGSSFEQTKPDTSSIGRSDPRGNKKTEYRLHLLVFDSCTPTLSSVESSCRAATRISQQSPRPHLTLVQSFEHTVVLFVCHCKKGVYMINLNWCVQPHSTSPCSRSWCSQPLDSLHSSESGTTPTRDPPERLPPGIATLGTAIVQHVYSSLSPGPGFFQGLAPLTHPLFFVRTRCRWRSLNGWVP